MKNSFCFIFISLVLFVSFHFFYFDMPQHQKAPALRYHTSYTNNATPPTCYMEVENKTCLLGAYKTISDENIFCYGPLQDMICNNHFRSILHTNCNGRLGNVMAAYATLYYFHKLGFQAVLDSHQWNFMQTNFNTSAFIFREGVRNFSSLPKGIVSETIADTDDAGVYVYDNFLANYKEKIFNHLLFVGIYPTPFKLFLEIMPELVKHFQFRDEIRDAAKLAIDTSTEKYRKENPGLRILNVGVHHRRGDHLNSAFLLNISKTDVMKQYFIFSFETIRNKYNNESSRVVFVLVGDDPTWMRESFGHFSDVVFTDKIALLPDTMMPGRDMLILGMSDLVIRSFGTFSLWGSLLCNCETIYTHVDSLTHETRYLQRMNSPLQIPVDIQQFIGFAPSTSPTTTTTRRITESNE